MERQKLGDKMHMGKPSKASNTKLSKKYSQMIAPQKQNFGTERWSDFHETLDDSSSLHGDAQSQNGAGEADFFGDWNRVSFSLDFKTKEELSDLKAKLQTELVSVRNLMRKIERSSGKQLQEENGASMGRLKRVHSEVESYDGSQLGKNKGATVGLVGSEMRNPLIGRSQENSDITLSDEKTSMSVHKKKSNANNKKNAEECVSLGKGTSSNKVFKSCSSLLNRLMKCKGCWWFNEPVDAKGLGLDDYFTIIKNPMDLGTVKSRLSTNRYKTPQEFAEDVRLTFQNAMTYNKEGNEVNAYAKQLLKMFEDKWAVIEADHLQYMNMTVDSALDLPTQTQAQATMNPLLVTPSLPPPTEMEKIVERSEAAIDPLVPEAKRTSLVASGKTRLPKPKAKDLHKRDMTLKEKQKLSESLQNLPPEKLEGVVRIIKKRNPSLCQNDDEIEVDIDTVDIETLWELDRFVIYYKKDLSKMRRSAKLAQIGVMVEPNLYEKTRTDFEISEAKEIEADENIIFSSASNEGEQEARNPTLSDDSSSSSSDSGSSSSGSDSDSSSS
ncbi:hypothetical protein V2J09_000044 [Rumex salicifolius]